MQLPPPLHDWQVTPLEAIALQKQLAPLVNRNPPTHVIQRIAGLDLAFTPDKKNCIAGVVLWDLSSQSVLEQHTILSPVTFPYIPGLLSFREIPALLLALAQLKQTPDAIMCDGQGIAHPRRLGIASHVGILTGLTTLGCGKSRLCGTYKHIPTTRGEFCELKDHNEVIGAVLCTKDRTKPVFVSIGHQIDLSTAIEIVLKCHQGYRLPEPTRLADKLVAIKKQSI